PPTEVLEDIVAAMKNQIAAHGLTPARLLGVGVGASGLVNHQTGVNVLAPNLRWRDVAVREFLETRLKLPVTIDNNVRAMALAEAIFGAGKGVNSLAFVYGRVGVGAGFVVGGKIFRGSSLGAGEIGHTIMIAEGGERCRCGNNGCLETLVSESQLIAQAAALVERYPDSVLARQLQTTGASLSIQEIFSAARAGDKHIRQMIEQRACYLGMALANLVNILNPELILLGGLFAEGHDLILPVAEAKMRSVAFAGLGDKVRLEVTRFGWQAGVLGAATMALMAYFYQEPEMT
ncbi:MAG TPA: ROK family protein, partial [Anaerolineales bacterium]|nr:ROK family protein [Anaerolineales bacterium]